VEKHDKCKKAGKEQQSAMDTMSHTVGSEAKDADTCGVAEKTQEATRQASGTATDYTK
jgi:hypothetical protein